jgi:hypothetical protein
VWNSEATTFLANTSEDALRLKNENERRDHRNAVVKTLFGAHGRILISDKLPEPAFTSIFASAAAHHVYIAAKLT